MRLSAAAVLAVLALACAPMEEEQVPERARIDFIAPPDPWPYPFSPAVRIGDLLYLSGQIGTTMQEGQMRLVTGGIDAEAKQTMDNIKQVLEANRSGMDRVVKCTVMLADMADWPKFNTIYATYFPGPKPARSALGANGLALGARVEVECIAAA